MALEGTIEFHSSAEEVVRRLPDMSRVVLVCDQLIYPDIKQYFREQPKLLLTIDGSESIKSWRFFKIIVDQLLKARVQRQDTLVAVGGGAVGDVVGFVASVINRGVPWINIPTTLLAQVDSSIGGKTAINTRYGKNLIGSFYPAKNTLICSSFLQTLDERQLKAGLAEIIKIAYIADGHLFRRLQRSTLETLDWQELVHQAVALKLRIIGNDIHEGMDEKGTRQLLNFGHTFGHAFEFLMANCLHGEAVALGMLAEADLAEYLSIASECRSEIKEILTVYNLPNAYKSCFPARFSQLFKYLSRDKKNVDAFTQFILPQQIGKVVKVKVAKPELYKFYKSCLGKV